MNKRVVGMLHLWSYWLFDIIIITYMEQSVSVLSGLGHFQRDMEGLMQCF